jgi:hypothetical protein
MSTEGSVGGVAAGTMGMLYLPEVRTGDQGFAFGLTAAWLGGCAEPWRTSVGSLAICGKALLGAIHSVVYTRPTESPGDRVWGAVSLSMSLRLRLWGPLFGELGAEALVPFWRYQFLISPELQTTFQETWVGGLGFVGLGLSIP